MVLSDIDIRAEINAGRLVFDPPILNHTERIDSSAVDLLLHHDILELPQNPVEGMALIPGEGNIMQLLHAHGSQHTIPENGTYTLRPHQLVIGKTLEYVNLPNHLAARIEGKSTLARMGLGVHITAPTVMAGFQGQLYLEMYNSGPFQIQLSTGMKIAQLILEQVSLPPLQGYQGQFQSQI